MDFQDEIRFPVVEARDAVANLIIKWANETNQSTIRNNSDEISKLTTALAELNKTIK